MPRNDGQDGEKNEDTRELREEVFQRDVQQREGKPTLKKKKGRANEKREGRAPKDPSGRGLR